MAPIYPEFCAAMLSQSVLSTNYDPKQHDSLDIPNYEFGPELLKAPLPTGPIDPAQFNSWAAATNIAFAFNDGSNQVVVIVHHFDFSRVNIDFYYHGYVFAQIGGHWVNVFDGAVGRGHITSSTHDHLNALALLYLKTAFWLLVRQKVITRPSPLSRAQLRRLSKSGFSPRRVPEFATLKLTVTQSTGSGLSTGCGTSRGPLTHAHFRRAHKRVYKSGKVAIVGPTIIARGKPFKPTVVVR